MENPHMNNPLNFTDKVALVTGAAHWVLHRGEAWRCRPDTDCGAGVHRQDIRVKPSIPA